MALSPLIKSITSKGGFLIIFSVVFFTATVIYLGLNSESTITIETINKNENFQARVENKLFSDRLPFWFAAYLQILEGPYFIVPSGRPLSIPGIEGEWVVGAHNTILEMLRINGLIAGSFILFIYFFALRNNLTVLVNSNEPINRTFAASVLAVGIVGMSTGDFPADLTVGFWIWSIAGFCHGLFLNEDNQSFNVNPRF